MLTKCKAVRTPSPGNTHEKKEGGARIWTWGSTNSGEANGKPPRRKKATGSAKFPGLSPAQAQTLQDCGGGRGGSEGGRRLGCLEEIDTHFLSVVWLQINNILFFCEARRRLPGGWLQSLKAAAAAAAALKLAGLGGGGAAKAPPPGARARGFSLCTG